MTPNVLLFLLLVVFTSLLVLLVSQQPPHVRRAAIKVGALALVLVSGLGLQQMRKARYETDALIARTDGRTLITALMMEQVRTNQWPTEISTEARALLLEGTEAQLVRGPAPAPDLVVRHGRASCTIEGRQFTDETATMRFTCQ